MLPDPLGVYLYRYLHRNPEVVYLSLVKGLITKRTTAAEFVGRIHITPSQQIKKGHGFTLQLSPLRLEDTDLYYCEWTFFKSETAKEELFVSNDTIIIVKGKK